MPSSAQPSGEQAVSVKQENTAPRSNEINVLVPKSDGTIVYGNEYVTIDLSNQAEGYVCVKYLGSNEKVKIQVTGTDGVTYTYNIESGKEAVYPLTSGSGSYTIGCYENMGDNQYAVVYQESLSVNVTNEFGPYLYPNQYVNFTKDSDCVPLAKELCEECESDITAVAAIYDYVVENISYDYDKASTVKSGYLPDVDQVLREKTGICFDYASLICSMLRSQSIPARLEVGYAGEAYHAWISVYIKDVGWINGYMEFDGENWTRMDPTFAANSSSDSVGSYIGDGTNYTTKYVY